MTANNREGCATVAVMGVMGAVVVGGIMIGQMTAAAEVGTEYECDKLIAQGLTELSSGLPEEVTRYREEIRQSAKRFCLPADLIGVVISVESGGNSGARSSQGAEGIMQIMPGDNALGLRFSCSNGECFSSCKPGQNGNADWDISCRPSRGWLSDPGNNIKYGCWLLRQNLEMRRGDLEAAIMDYGPSNQRELYRETVLGLGKVLPEKVTGGGMSKPEGGWRLSR